MKKVVLESLTLTNWRGEKERTTEFNPVETTIQGDNGLGKTRHFDAFIWLLFGKDSQDRKDFKIRTLVEGGPLHHVECSVVGVLNVDGEIITLKRSFAERWVKPRGQVDEVFKGNETETYWNDVPVSVTDYQSRVNDIVDDSVFKMVTNPSFFVRMKWQDQREQLFKLAGTITDAEIAAQKPEFAALLDKISGKSLADFKSEIAARKKRLKDDLAQIQPRIDQTHKLMPAKSDFAALEVEIANLEKQIQDIDRAIADKSEAIRGQYEAMQKKQSEINELKQKRQQVLFDAQTKAKDDIFKANEKRREVENAISLTKRENETLNISIERCVKTKQEIAREIEKKKSEVDLLRQSWSEENGKEYAGNDICHTCRQPLPESMKADARQLFADAKAKKLSELKAKGTEINIEIDRLYKDLDAFNGGISRDKNRVSENEGVIAKLQTQLAAMPVVDGKDINPDDLPEYVSLNSLITGLEQTLESGTQKIDTTELQSQKREINTGLDAAKSELKNRDLIEQYTAEINKLEAQGKDLAQQIADAEREEYAIQNFTKTKIEECEKRINGLFSFVRFKLFDYTIDGNEVETCEPLIDGVPYEAANSASKVNAGLDIINSLCRFYSVCAPIFIDGRESINKIVKTESQVINLVVSHDKSLIIK